MGADQDDGKSGEGGLLGWRDWKVPRFFLDWDITPIEGVSRLGWYIRTGND